MIFISYASKDHAEATKICHDLERRGVECWIASRDIGPGDNYQESITAAIQRARALVLVLTEHAIASAEIKKELSLASSFGIAVIPARTQAITPTGAFKYELSIVQWIDLFDNWDHALDRLADRIKHIGTASQPPAPAAEASRTPKRTKMPVVLVSAAAAVIAAAAVAVLYLHQSVPDLRSAPAKLFGSQIDAMLTRLDLYDERRNAAGHGLHHHYHAQAIGDAVVIADSATGLMWQKIGSRDALTLPSTPDYINRLNAGKYAGFNDWRLPTVEEAMTLTEKHAHGDWHISPEFLSEDSANYVWTSDRSASSGRGFVIYYADGFLAAESPDLNAYVRAVRRISP